MVQQAGLNNASQRRDCAAHNTGVGDCGAWLRAVAARTDDAGSGAVNAYAVSASSTTAAGHAPSSLNISQHGVDFIKEQEGFRANAYKDPSGAWTIGYGHTGGVKPGDHVTLAQAEALLRQNLSWAVNAVRHYVKVRLTQGQFDALVSFTFNMGAAAFRNSTLLRKLNAGNYAGARAEFGRWVHGGGKVLPGLVRRRRAEAQMFGASAPAGSAPAGSSVKAYPPYTMYSSGAGGVKHITNASQLLPHHDYQHKVRQGQNLEVRDVVLTHPGQSNAGQRIPSPVTGTVISAGPMGTAGNAVVIRANDGGLVYLFHMSKVEVKAGQHVTYGQEVGLQGSTGHSTGPHVHIEASHSVIVRWVNDLIDGKFDGRH